MTDREKKCPACGSADRVPIVYGYPTHETAERAERGEVALGGCLIHDLNPRWRCKACGATWGRWREINR